MVALTQSHHMRLRSRRRRYLGSRSGRSSDENALGRFLIAPQRAARDQIGFASVRAKLRYKAACYAEKTLLLSIAGRDLDDVSPGRLHPRAEVWTRKLAPETPSTIEVNAIRCPKFV